MTCRLSFSSSVLICLNKASPFVFVSSKTMVAVWAIGLGSTDTTPGILDTVTLTVTAELLQRQPGTLMTMVLLAANTLWLAPSDNAKKAAIASIMTHFLFIGSSPSLLFALL